MCGWMCVGRWVVLLTEWMHVGVCVQVQACIKFTYTLTKRELRSLVSRSAAAAGEAPRGAWRGGGLSCLRLEAAFPPSPLEGYIVSFKNS